jgi:hypothetical protein
VTNARQTPSQRAHSARAGHLRIFSTLFEVAAREICPDDQDIILARRGIFGDKQ